jgi:capsular polysaccharide biosynthesis protein
MQRCTMTSFQVSPAAECHYQLFNSWNLPLGRLQPFCEPFEVPEGFAHIVHPSTFWFFPAALDSARHPVAELRPFSRSLSKLENWIVRLTGRFPQGPELPGPFCSMIAPSRRHYQYFHWLLDLLPVLLAAERYCLGSGDRKPMVLLQRPLKKWQAESLQLIGYSKDQWRFSSWCTFSPVRVEKLFVTEYSRASIGCGPRYDAISPFAVRELKSRLGKSSQNGPMSQAENSPDDRLRLYISRADAASRRIVNESALESLLIKSGFQILRLSELSFARQIRLFQAASHVLSVHGGGLANLVFAAHAYVLEIHASGHQVRPEYFQIASINKCSYSFFIAASLNEANDIYLPKHVLKKWLAFAGC